jgi:hypothetical protein
VLSSQLQCVTAGAICILKCRVGDHELTAAYQSQPEGLTYTIDELTATVGQMAHRCLVGLPEHFTQWEAATADLAVDIRVQV